MPSEEPPAEPTPDQEQTLIQTITEILLAGLAVQVTLDLLGKALAVLKIGAKAVQVAYRIMTSQRRNTYEYSDERILNRYSAWFLLNSAKRLQRGLADGTPIKDLLHRELRYVKAHFSAQAIRAEAHREAQRAADISEGFTGRRVARWHYAQSPAACTPINKVTCKMLDGHIFEVDKPPQGLLPGERHPNCRCRAMPVVTATPVGKPYADREIRSSSK